MVVVWWKTICLLAVVASTQAAILMEAQMRSPVPPVWPSGSRGRAVLHAQIVTLPTSCASGPLRGIPVGQLQAWEVHKTASVFRKGFGFFGEPHQWHDQCSACHGIGSAMCRFRLCLPGKGTSHHSVMHAASCILAVCESRCSLSRRRQAATSGATAFIIAVVLVRERDDIVSRLEGRGHCGAVEHSRPTDMSTDDMEIMKAVRKLLSTTFCFSCLLALARSSFRPTSERERARLLRIFSCKTTHTRREKTMRLMRRGKRTVCCVG